MAQAQYVVFEIVAVVENLKTLRSDILLYCPSDESLFIVSWEEDEQ